MSAAILSRPRDTERADAGSARPPASPRRAPTSKWQAAAFSIGLIALVASPVAENWKSEPRDSFPLSYYRMFSEPRADRQRLTHLVGLDGGGNRYLIPYRFAGTGGMNQVRKQISKLVDQGEAATLCRSVASRLARSTSSLPDLTTVEVITGSYRLSAYFTGNRAPLEENVRARCAAQRPDRR